MVRAHGSLTLEIGDPIYLWKAVKSRGLVHLETLKSSGELSSMLGTRQGDARGGEPSSEFRTPTLMPHCMHALMTQVSMCAHMDIHGDSWRWSPRLLEVSEEILWRGELV